MTVTDESVKESVAAAMSEGEGTSAESAPAEPKEESSGEVKPVVAEEVKPIVESVMAPGETSNSESRKDVREDQINNLNKALSIEREARKKLEEELGSVKPVFEKFKNVFSPEQEKVEEQPAQQTEEQKFEEWYKQKELAKSAEEQQSKLQELIKTQIEKLSTEWNGEEGKPKYDDNEVYKWQRDNGKEYLTPEEAFVIMKRDDIIDWKARAASESQPKPVGSERPSGVSSEHAPSKSTPKTDQEIKNAVLEAMSSIE